MRWLIAWLDWPLRLQRSIKSQGWARSRYRWRSTQPGVENSFIYLSICIFYICISMPKNLFMYRRTYQSISWCLSVCILYISITRSFFFLSIYLSILLNNPLNISSYYPSHNLLTLIYVIFPFIPRFLPPKLSFSFLLKPLSSLHLIFPFILYPLFLDLQNHLFPYFYNFSFASCSCLLFPN